MKLDLRELELWQNQRNYEREIFTEEYEQPSHIKQLKRFIEFYEEILSDKNKN